MFLHSNTNKAKTNQTRQTNISPTKNIYIHMYSKFKHELLFIACVFTHVVNLRKEFLFSLTMTPLDNDQSTEIYGQASLDWVEVRHWVFLESSILHFVVNGSIEHISIRMVSVCVLVCTFMSVSVYLRVVFCFPSYFCPSPLMSLILLLWFLFDTCTFVRLCILCVTGSIFSSPQLSQDRVATIRHII